MSVRKLFGRVSSPALHRIRPVKGGWLPLVVALLAVAACGKSPTAPGSSGGSSSGGSNPSIPCTVGSVGSGGRGLGTMTAQINGSTWRADCIFVTTTVTGIIGIGAGDLATGPSFQNVSFAVTRALGTYTVNAMSGLNATVSQSISASPRCGLRE